MAEDQEWLQTSRQMVQAAAHIAFANGMTLLSPGWVFQEITPVRAPDGTSGYAVRSIDASVTLRVDVGQIEATTWTDEQLSYRIEIFAVDLAQIPGRPPRAVLHAAESHANDEIPALTLAIRRARVIHPGSSVYAQMEWHPGWIEPEYSYGGVTLGSKKSTNDTAVADAGLDLLAVFQRPQGGRHLLEDDEDSGWLALTERAIEKKRNRPDLQWKQIAKGLHITPKTLKRYRDRRAKLTRE